MTPEYGIAFVNYACWEVVERMPGSGYPATTLGTFPTLEMALQAISQLTGGGKVLLKVLTRRDP